jgi:hypothetical protein
VGEGRVPSALPPAGEIRSPALLVALSLAGVLVIPLLEKKSNLGSARGGRLVGPCPWLICWSKIGGSLGENPFLLGGRFGRSWICGFGPSKIAAPGGWRRPRR